MQKKSRTISSLRIGCIYSYIHFAVEVACFYFLFSRFSNSQLWWGFALLYDALAFVPQGFIDIIADKYSRFNYSILGMTIVLVSLVLPFDFFALILIGIGNSSQHKGTVLLCLCRGDKSAHKTQTKNHPVRVVFRLTFS